MGPDVDASDDVDVVGQPAKATSHGYDSGHSRGREDISATSEPELRAQSTGMNTSHNNRMHASSGNRGCITSRGLDSSSSDEDAIFRRPSSKQSSIPRVQFDDSPGLVSDSEDSSGDGVRSAGRGPGHVTTDKDPSHTRRQGLVQSRSVKAPDPQLTDMTRVMRKAIKTMQARSFIMDREIKNMKGLVGVAERMLQRSQSLNSSSIGLRNSSVGDLYPVDFQTLRQDNTDGAEETDAMDTIAEDGTEQEVDTDSAEGFDIPVRSAPNAKHRRRKPGRNVPSGIRRWTTKDKENLARMKCKGWSDDRIGSARLVQSHNSGGNRRDHFTLKRFSDVQ